MYSEATPILFFERLRLRPLPTIMQEHSMASLSSICTALRIMCNSFQK